MRIKDIPNHLTDVLEKADKWLKEGNAHVHFKYTCLNCGARQTFTEPDTMYKEGQCEECEHISDLFDQKADVGFILIIMIPPISSEVES